MFETKHMADVKHLGWGLTVFTDITGKSCEDNVTACSGELPKE